MSVTEHLQAMLEIGASTIFLFKVICAAASYQVKNKVASIFTLLAVYPVAMVLSISTYYGCMLAGLFEPQKMADWLVWTVVAGTTGTLLAIAVIIAATSLIDRQPAAAVR